MNIKKLEWCDQAARALFPVLGNDAAAIEQEVSAGVSELFCVEKNSYLVTRVEGDCLIVPCFIGSHVRQVASAIYDAAKRAGCRSVQFHTARPGLARMLHEFGAVCVGQYYIYNVEVDA